MTRARAVLIVTVLLSVVLVAVGFDRRAEDLRGHAQSAATS